MLIASFLLYSSSRHVALALFLTEHLSVGKSEKKRRDYKTTGPRHYCRVSHNEQTSNATSVMTVL